MDPITRHFLPQGFPARILEDKYATRCDIAITKIGRAPRRKGKEGKGSFPNAFDKLKALLLSKKKFMYETKK